jgi:hypothetical protein
MSLVFYSIVPEIAFTAAVRNNVTLSASRFAGIHVSIASASATLADSCIQEASTALRFGTLVSLIFELPGFRIT